MLHFVAKCFDIVRNFAFRHYENRKHELPLAANIFAISPFY